jgi:DNA-binding winged helix-turn-helix (wHTH) protein
MLHDLSPPRSQKLHESDDPPVAAFARRPSQSASSAWIARFGRCEVRVAHREIWVDGQVRALQPRPFDVLIYLIEHRHRVITADELLDQIWSDEVVQPGSLAAAIMRVRKAVGDGEADIGSVIRTYQRVGYRFVAALDSEIVTG